MPTGSNLFDQEPWARRGEAQAAAAAAVSGALPVGVITAYWGTVAPTNWLVCDGTPIPVQYSTLIALVGANTPNLKGRVVVGIDAAQTEFDTLAETGGAKTSVASHVHAGGSHTHPHSHTHDLQNHTHVGGSHDHGGGTGIHAHIVNGAWLEDGGGDVPGTNRWRYAVGVNVNNPSTDSPGQANTFESPVTGAPSNNTSNLQSVTNTAGPDGATDTGAVQTVGAAAGNLQPYIALTYIIKAQ